MANSKPAGVKTPSVYFIREMTVLNDVGDNKSVKPESIIDCIEFQCGGNDCVAACVPKSCHFRKNCPHPACRSCNLVLSKCTCERESHFVFHGAKSGKRKSQAEPHFGVKRTFEGTNNSETLNQEEAPSPEAKSNAQDDKSTLNREGDTQTQIDDDDNTDTLKLDDNDG
ncbi:unnamed protein product [Mytilus coruscus]|uniref:Uncharacterized protein n=1 Tax=Mytilus coruscus TaxID=42192 RepID=A0A6J8B8Q0_MYTCO|nr:unnamed protein product [Mytilus coruscus]